MFLLSHYQSWPRHLSLPPWNQSVPTPVERTALQNLRYNEDIIIKPADKGSAVVDIDKSAYIREAERQLSDDRFDPYFVSSQWYLW
jgi:hypothetical protein